MGGVTTALFTALALEKVPIEEWTFILVDELYSDVLREHLDTKNLDKAWDYNQYIKHWKKYIATKFLNKHPIKNRANSNPMYRIKYYYDNFYKETPSIIIGDSGYLSTIMAYDALLNCDGKWEKLVIYGALHCGDSDTICAIAGGCMGQFTEEVTFQNAYLKILKNATV